MSFIDKDHILAFGAGRLHDGHLNISGYKHAMVQAIACCIAQNQSAALNNVPHLTETSIITKILQNSGCTVDYSGDTLRLDPTKMDNSSIDPLLSQEIHGSLYLVPAYVARFGEAVFHGAGGCPIGENGGRPVQHVLDVMEKFGIKSSITNGAVKCERTQTIRAVDVDAQNYSDDPSTLSGPAVSGATKTALICAAMADETRIRNPYLKSDVFVHLDVLQQMGYRVDIDLGMITIRKPLSPNRSPGIDYTLNSCVSEIVTYAIAAAIHDIDLVMKIKKGERVAQALAPELTILSRMGLPVEITEDAVSVGRANTILGQAIIVDNSVTSIQSDHHPFLVLLMAIRGCRGSVADTVWRKRVHYAEVLSAMGASIRIEGNTVHVDGAPNWVVTRNVVSGGDVRSSAVIALLGTLLNSKVYIEGAHHLSRGYVDFVGKLISLGANIDTYANARLLAS
ncbi:NikO protein [Rhizobium rhizogenes]|uniref:UDP-N-acetylglucosamine 1-carboxyvinyltransferase n=1 Tax=Rhizobium rhizogenes (strain K84 / ATCC BAA-868) TaxID=311403 RepID=B9JPU0_RHIR8|nr:NikO protein [Rhizobium rhizogenes K84]NTG77916.1 NikO protein [Rhizobium rhizogenes]